MFWSIAGILLWLGGWWFTARLFPVYRKAIYFENQERKLKAPQSLGVAHSGPTLLLLFDLGLLLPGVRGLIDIEQALASARTSPGGGPPGPGDMPGAAASAAWQIVPYAGLLCIYGLRGCRMLHAFYAYQVRSLGGPAEAGGHHPDRLAALFAKLAPSSYALLLAALAASLAAAGLRLAGWLPQDGPVVAALLWIAGPAAITVLALRPPIRDLKREFRRRSSTPVQPPSEDILQP